MNKQKADNASTTERIHYAGKWWVPQDTQPEAASLPQEDDTYWAFQYSDGSWWTDNIFGTREQAERFAKGPDADLVEGATLREVVIRPTDSGSKK